MSNLAELYTTADDAAPLRHAPPHAHDFGARSAYHIPVGWLALFTPDDLRMMRFGDDAASEELPVFICGTGDAAARLRTRIPALVREFGEIARAPLDGFQDELARAELPFVRLETMDIGSMISTPVPWANDLREMVAAVDELSTARSHGALPGPFGKEGGGLQRYRHYFPKLSETLSEAVGAYFVGEQY